MSKDEDGTGVLGLEDEGTFDWLDLVLDGASTTWADLEDDMFTLLVVGLFRGLAVPLTDSALEEPFAGDVDTEALVLTSEVRERGRGVVVVEGGFGGVDLLFVGASTLKDEFSSDLVENLSGCVALLLIDWRLGVFLAVRVNNEASHMTHFDLKGCGILTRTAICCLSLLLLDASYCC